MKAQDVMDELDLKSSRRLRLLPGAGVHKPRLLGDNGSSYVSADVIDRRGAQNYWEPREPRLNRDQGRRETKKMENTTWWLILSSGEKMGKRVR